MREPELSVVLPFRNGAATIGDQLEALARQESSRPWELILVDNGSTDESLEIVAEYGPRLPAHQVVEATDLPGAPHACNRGVAVSRGKAVAFCNDDDVVDDHWVEAMADALSRHEHVVGRLDHDRLNEPWVLEVRGRPQAGAPAEWGVRPYLPFGFGCTIGVSRRLHDAVGGFDEELIPAGEDMDYCWRLQLAGAELRFVPEAVTHYRLRHGLREIYRQGRNYGIGNVLVYKKHRQLGLASLPHPWLAGARAWLSLAKSLVVAWNKVRLGRFLWNLGWRTGMLEGSIRQRVLLLG